MYGIPIRAKQNKTKKQKKKILNPPAARVGIL